MNPSQPQPERPHRIGMLIPILGGLLAIAVRWFYVMHAQVLQPLDDPNVRADAAEYYHYAWNLAHHGTFSSALPDALARHPDSFRDPGYALFLALWMRLTSGYDGWYAGVLLSQAFLGGLTVALLALAARNHLRSGFLAGATFLMALWPHSVVAPSFVLSETLFGFLCALAVFCLRTMMDRPRLPWTFASGIAIGCAALTNAILVPFGFAVALAMAWRRHATWRTALILACASLLLPLAWNVRGLLIPSANTAYHRAAMNFVQGSWPTYHPAYQLAMKGDEDGITTIAAIDAEIATFDLGAKDGLTTVMSRMATAPWTYVGWYLRKPALLWDWDIRIGQGDVYVYPTRNSPFRTQFVWRVAEAACFLVNPLLLLLAATGCGLALFQGSSSSIGLILATMTVVVTLVYSILQAEPRYSTAFRGVEILLAALALQTLWLIGARRNE